jgi:glycosyltransferase involved in cell wall biosynthesis
MALRNQFYYGIKPLIPASIRQMVRRWFARRKRRKLQDVWPILPGSERPPEGWPGWPGGKKFAFILTHDVEGPGGVAKCRRLMELEMKWGFRSSFNFIPEGDYRVSRELREELIRNGFEVGVHDLHHDGKLYQSRNGFAKKATQINRYLKEWGGAGFRSGFMLHNLDWLVDLNIKYDASTFDTDPFEPQPDGTGTIFPFWKEGGNGRGFVELAYTLAQDSTLFLLFGERSPDIWLRKLDWVAERGGMALVNVHPDYMRFEGEAAGSGTYPEEFYRRLLQHVREKHGQTAWHVRPEELAAWYAETEATKQKRGRLSSSALRGAPPAGGDQKLSLPPGRVAVVLYSYYLTDPRPRRETEALVEAGMEADVICLRRDSSEPAFEVVNGVNIHRVSLTRRRDKQGGYVVRYSVFFLSAFWRLAVWSLRRKYKLVHVHNMPDFLVFTALVPRLNGAKVILDLHDPMPELYCGIYNVKEKHFVYRLLCRLERWSIAFADRVLTPNIAFKDLFASRNKASGKVEIVMNSPRPAVFDAEKYQTPARAGGKPLTLMNQGMQAHRHGLDLAIDALSRLNGEAPGIRLEIYGDQTDYIDQVLRQVDGLKMQERVHFHGYKTQTEIAGAIAGADLGLIPNRLNEFTNINFPTRIFEYLAMNKPVIVPRTKGVTDYFGEDEILFFQPGDIDDLARKIAWAFAHPAELQSIMDRGREIYRRNSWAAQEKQLIGVVGGLLSPASKTSQL